MPDVSIRIDTTEFARVFKEYRKVSTRELATDINQKAYSILIAAAAMTPKADKGKIASEVGPSGKEVVGYKVRAVRRRATKAEYQSSHGKP